MESCSITQIDYQNKTSTTSKNAYSRFFIYHSFSAADYFYINPVQVPKTYSNSTKNASVPTSAGGDPVNGSDVNGLCGNKKNKAYTSAQLNALYKELESVKNGGFVGLNLGLNYNSLAGLSNPTGICYSGLPCGEKIRPINWHTCGEAFGLSLGGGLYTVGSAAYGIITSETVVGAFVGWSNAVLGAGAVATGVYDLSQGACG